ncbi:MAG: TetR/AcrR family transcriptional regulator [Campylobacterota bacterium]
MAIIVDKVQKRKEIALSCKELFVQNSMSTITSSLIAKTAGVGKGTIYEYFKNKEEIVFEIATVLMQEHAQKLEVDLSKQKSTKEKVRKFSEFFYSEEEFELRAIYKDFISISLAAPQEDMLAFHTECFHNYYSWFESILKEGVESGELKKETLGLSRGLFVTAEGMFVSSCVTNSVDSLEKELNSYIDNMFELLEAKA